MNNKTRYVRHGAQLAFEDWSHWAKKKINRQERLKAKRELRNEQRL